MSAGGNEGRPRTQDLDLWTALLPSLAVAGLDGLMVVDSTGRIREVNPAYCHMVGYERDHLIGLHVQELDALERAESIQKNLEVVAAAGRARFERVHRRRDGAFVEVEITAMTLQARGEQLFLVVLRDLDDVRQSKRRSTFRARLVRLFAGAPTPAAYLTGVAQLLREATGCAVAAVRTKHRPGHPRLEAVDGEGPGCGETETDVPDGEGGCPLARCVLTGTGCEALAACLTPAGSVNVPDLPALLASLGRASASGPAERCAHEGLMTALLVPVHVGSEVQALIRVTDPRRRALSHGTVAFVESLAPMIGEALYHYEVDATLKEQRDRTSGLLDATDDLVVVVQEREGVAYVNAAARGRLGQRSEQEFAACIGVPAEVLAPPAAERGAGPWRRELPSTVTGAIYDLTTTRVAWTEGMAGALTFIHDITERTVASTSAHRRADVLAVVNELLRLSLEDHEPEEVAARALDLVLTVPWLSVEARGAVFFVDPSKRELVLVAHRGLAPALLESCARVPFGHCLCGRAALGQDVVYASNLDARHDVRYDGIRPHGHYCVPIAQAGRVLGVLNIYVAAGHAEDLEEVEFLRSVANALAGVIRHRQVAREKEVAQSQLRQSQKLESIGALAGGAAHDFNNILSVIQGHADLAIEGMDAAAPAYQDLQEIQQATVRAAYLTRQLLLFSRQEQIEMADVCLAALVEGMRKFLHRLLGEDVRLQCALAPDLWTIRGDVGTLEQVVMNLCVNARDAMPEGGGLTLALDNVMLGEVEAASLPGARPGAFVRLTVRDQGVGMSPEVLERIFEPFFTTKPRGKGTGLGLSVVYGIVRQHEGFVHVTSTPGVGTAFELFFPTRERGATTQGPTCAASKTCCGHGERILVVEDDENLSRLVGRMLEEHGYRPLLAGSGALAFAAAAGSPEALDLAFVDVVLPDTNGFRLVEELRRSRPALPALFCSGYTDHRARMDQLRAAGEQVLRKPYDLAGLLRAVEDALKRRP